MTYRERGEELISVHDTYAVDHIANCSQVHMSVYEVAASATAGHLKVARVVDRFLRMTNCKICANKLVE